MEKGLLSADNTEYCYMSAYDYEKFYLCVSFRKTKYNYRIDVWEEIKEIDEEKVEYCDLIT